MSSSVHFGDKGKDILILGEGPTQALDGTALIAEGKYPINFTQPGKRFVLSFLIEDNELFEKYNTTWDRVSVDIKKEFDSETVNSKNSLKTKIKSHGDKFLLLDSNRTFLAVISLDYPPQKNDSYHPQVFLKECKYIEKKVVRHIYDSWVIFLILPMSLMKNKLELASLFKK